MVETPISLYFHIPFCTKKCDYCHFYVLPDKEIWKEQLLEALQLEWKRTLPLLAGCTVETIYFGGGTPALFGPGRIAEVLSWVKSSLPFTHSDPEITLEINPENVTSQLVQAYAKAGINRVSMGVQAFDDKLLNILGRTHDASQAIKAVHQIAEAGIHNISIDLMFDLPHQTMEHWQTTLKQAVSLPITHLSLYNLTIEPHTGFHKREAALRPLLPPAETSTQMYIEAVKQLEEVGLMQYEISAFAKEGAQAQHNLGYWTARPFWGFGPSAFSYWNGKRFRNVANLSRYRQALEADLSPVDFEEELTTEAKKRELLVIQLRMMTGCHLSTFQKQYGPLDQETQAGIQELISDGLLTLTSDRLQLTQKGILFYDTVASELI